MRRSKRLVYYDTRLARLEDFTMATRTGSETKKRYSIRFNNKEDRNRAIRVLAEDYDRKWTIRASHHGDDVSLDEEIHLRRINAQDYAKLKEAEDQLVVKKLRRHGKYSIRYKAKEIQGREEAPDQKKCKSCGLGHPHKGCWAAGQVCYGCGGVGHYARARACPAWQAAGGGGGRHSHHSTDGERPYEEENLSRAPSPTWRVTMQDPAKRIWPGAQAGSEEARRRDAVQDPTRREARVGGYNCNRVTAQVPAKTRRPGVRADREKADHQRAAGWFPTRAARRHSYSDDRLESHGRRVTDYTRPEVQAGGRQRTPRRHSHMQKERCPDCHLGHRQGICEAVGRICYSCHGRGHYARTCRTEAAEDSLGKQQGGHRAVGSPDTETCYDGDTEGESSDDQDDQEGPDSSRSTQEEATEGSDEERKEPEHGGERLEGERERLSRALATVDGYQGIEPGLEEDKSEGTGEKPEEVEGSDGEGDDGIKALREGTEPAWPGSQQWKTQMRRKSKQWKLKQVKLAGKLQE
jgi:hypothetical protein